MVVKCEFVFDQNALGTYFAGQLVSGSVTLKSDKVKEVKAVTLKVSGFAETNWSEKVFDKRRHYTGHEDYLTNLVYLLGSEESIKCSLQAGTHKYTFDFQLPYNCPTSIESSNGHIRYVLKVSLIRPWKHNQTFTKGFSVINLKDLNRESPLLRQPSTTVTQKTYGCGPCRSEPIGLEVNLPHTGFVPGQTISITITVTNDSHVPVQALKIYLVMNVTCKSNTPTSNAIAERMIVSKLKGDGVLRHCKKLYNYELEIPATPPTCLKLCHLIQIQYELNVEACVRGLHASQFLTIPITIGNVPFREIIESQPRSMSKFENIDLSAQSLSSLEASTSHETPIEREARKHQKWVIKAFTELPPKYEEANHVPHARLNANEQHDYGDKEFKPHYPVFSLLSSSKIVGSSDEK